VHEISTRVLLQFALTGELRNDQWIDRTRQFPHLLRCEIVERMRRHYERQGIDLQVLGRKPRGRDEGGRNYRRSRNAALLEIR